MTARFTTWASADVAAVFVYLLMVVTTRIRRSFVVIWHSGTFLACDDAYITDTTLGSS